MPRHIIIEAQIGRHDDDPRESYIVYQDGREVYRADNQPQAITQACRLVELHYPHLVSLTVVHEVTLATITCDVTEEENPHALQHD